MSSLLCKSYNMNMVISSSYHSFISFVLRPFFYNISYSFRYTTSYNCASFTMSMWSYHQWFGYPFAMLFMLEWAHYNPRYASRYCYSYCVREWSSCIERSFPPFPLPYMETSGYYCHHRWFPNLCECCHCQFESYRFGVTFFDDDNTCNNNCHSKQGTILHKMNIRRWFHSPTVVFILILSRFWPLVYMLL